MVGTWLGALVDAAATLLVIMLLIGALLLLRFGPRPRVSRLANLAVAIQPPPLLAAEGGWLAGLRSLFKALSMGGTTFVAAGLLAGTILAWQHATPDNGLGLAAGLLALLTIMAFLSLFAPLATKVETEAAAAAPVAPPAPVLFFSAPEILRLDEEEVRRAVRLRRAGVSHDEICAVIEPDYPTWDESRRRMLGAMVEVILDGTEVAPVEAATVVAPPTWFFSAPEILRIDEDSARRAVAMRRGGAPLDDICAAIDPGYPDWDEHRRRMFGVMAEAMLDGETAEAELVVRVAEPLSA